MIKCFNKFKIINVGEIMRKLKLALAFVLLMAVALFTCSCVDLSAFGIQIPGFTTQTCTVHRDINKDLRCDVCGVAVPANCTNHQDLDHDGVCDTNGCNVVLTVSHYDEDHDGNCDEPLCTKTGMRVDHEDEDMNRKCDVCGAEIKIDCECYDGDEDGTCDDCGYEILPCEHVDRNEDGYCDECDEELEEECDECVDKNGDGKCDVCGGKVDAAPPATCEHTDANFDGKCDICKAAMEGVIPIYENGKLNYTIVLAAGAPMDYAMAVDNLIRELQGYNLTVTRGEDSAYEATDYEIYFGMPTARDEIYQVDPHQYGVKGYGIQIIGTKIIIVSGSDKTFSTAVEAFKETFLGITASTKKLTTRFISESTSISEIQDDYDVSTITLLGKDMKGFTIAADKKDTTCYTVALSLQDMLYSRTGYWFDIVPVEEADKSIVIKMQPKNMENVGFYANFTDGRMEFISEYPTVVNNKVISFFTTALSKAKTSGTMAIEAKDSFSDDVRYVYYRDYGAVGDGETDDSEAIRAAHEYANLGGHKVMANDSKTYYIGKLEKTIPVKTDVDWLNAKFIIDDSIIEPLEKTADGKSTYRSVNIFTIISPGTISNYDFKLKINEINAAGGIDASKFKSFNIEFGQPLLIAISNTDHKNYVRYGVNASDGAAQKEVILVDEHGNIDPTTPFMHDFEKITTYGLYIINEEPITIEGGLFYTKPFLSDTPQNYNAYGRGINCGRSNVTFKNVKHFIINEGEYQYNNHANSTDYGCPYGGFFETSYTNNVTYDNCQFAAHIVYKGSNGAGMGTYDLSPGYATNVLYKECYQEDDNFFNASGQNRWGVMGSSYCKNVTFLDSKLTRFDAHNGIHNAFIINTEIKMIRVNGTGNFVMENCIMHSTTLVSLREDYGGFWDGNIILKNNVMIGASSVTMFTNTWYNHYFGYPARYPSNIVIDGLKIYGNRDDYANGKQVAPENVTITLFGSGILTGAKNIVEDYLPIKDAYYPDGTPVVLPNKCQATPPERITIRNLQGCNIIIPNKTEYTWFESTEYVVNQTTDCAAHFDHIPDGLCDDCGADFTPCTEHVDTNNDGKCCFCGSDVEIRCDKHVDKELNGKCDICDVHYVCDAHVDAEGDTICDKCGGVLGCKDAHIDADEDGYCDLCTKLIPKCEVCVDLIDIYKREIQDNKCDVCKADMMARINPCESCVDTDKDGKCDVCGANVEVTVCDHTYSTDCDTTCNDCGEVRVAEHVDEDPEDSVCDLCGEEMPAAPACEHIDEDPQDNVCDLCEEEMPAAPACEHIDEDPQDNVCDLCEEEMPAA